jgi:hypothetical protein
MRTDLFIFTYKQYTVEYRIMARSQRRATTLAREQEQAWRLAKDARERHAS